MSQHLASAGTAILLDSCSNREVTNHMKVCSCNTPASVPPLPTPPPPPSSTLSSFTNPSPKVVASLLPVRLHLRIEKFACNVLLGSVHKCGCRCPLWFWHICLPVQQKGRQGPPSCSWSPTQAPSSTPSWLAGSPWLLSNSSKHTQLNPPFCLPWANAVRLWNTLGHPRVLVASFV